MDDTSLTEPTPDAVTSGSADANPTEPGPRRTKDRADRLAPLTFDVHRAPERTDAWLHVVSGPSAPAVARAVLELAARFLSCGQRVLILDGGPRLGLHRRFEREGRWGMGECLTGDMPVLGLVQDVGRSGLYLLAHGAPSRHNPWSEIGRMLDEAQPHFGRAILAIEPDAPAAIGDALAGWHLEGWWAEHGRASRPAARMADRLGIHLAELDLSGTPEVTLDVLDARIESLSSGDGMTAAPVLGDSGPPTAAAEPPAGPVVLGCDLHVRERLRFLLWMRRVQSEGRPA